MNNKYNCILNDFNKLNESFKNLNHNSQLVNLLEAKKSNLENCLIRDQKNLLKDASKSTESLLSESVSSEKSLNNLKQDFDFGEDNFNRENLLVILKKKIFF